MSQTTIGIALAGGGPLGAIYEIGALVALDEALAGKKLTDCDIYLGVSSGGFLAAGLANGITPQDMYRMFIASESASDLFEPEILLRPALKEYQGRLTSLPALFTSGIRDYLDPSQSRGFFEAFQRLAKSIPTGLFDNTGICQLLTNLFDAPGRTNDFRSLEHKLFLIATDLDSCEAVAFGSDGWDDVPIALAVQASAALPGLYPPVEIRGRHFVDGALVKTLHASVALEEGARLLLCVNPIVPYDSRLAAEREGGPNPSLVEGGLAMVLSQTFRSIIHSRLHVTMSRYGKEFPDSDVVLFEPCGGDEKIFFTNVFSYADRDRLSEIGFQTTRSDILHRYDAIAPVFARHGLEIERERLADKDRTLVQAVSDGKHNRLHSIGQITTQLGETLDRLERLLGSQS